MHFRKEKLFSLRAGIAPMTHENTLYLILVLGNFALFASVLVYAMSISQR